MKLLNNDVYSLEKFLFFLTIFFGFWGVAVFSVDLGPFALFPYRVFLLFLWFFFFLRVLIQGKLAIPSLQIKNYFLFFLIWLGYALLTLAWAKDRFAAVEDVVFLTMAISVIFFTVYYSRKENDLNTLYWLWIIVFFLLIIIGFWEHITGNHLPISGYFGETRPKFMYRPTGVFKNPNDYATLLALSVPFGSALIKYKKRLEYSVFGVVIVLSGFYLILQSGSRANILAVIVELGFLYLMLQNTKNKFKYGMALLVLAFVLFFINTSLLQFVYRDLFRNLNSLIAQVKSWSGSMMVRMNLVRNGFLFVLSSGGFGVGAGNAEYWMSNFGVYYTGEILNPHNWWLENFINYGVLISFGYFTMYLNLLWNLWKRWKEARSRNDKMISEALLLALVGFFFASMSSSSIMAFKPQWFLFAFSLAFLNYQRIKQTS